MQRPLYLPVKSFILLHLKGPVPVKVKPDLTYSEAGLFVAFYAETPAGEEAYREMAEHSGGTCKFLAPMRAGIVAQLRAAKALFG